MKQRSSMQDLVKRTCENVQDVDYEGVYYPDEEQVKAIEEWEPESEESVRERYNYVNLGPQRVKEMLATETDPVEIARLRNAHDFWSRHGGYAPNPDDLGWVDRGDAREAVHASDMTEVANSGNRVDYVSVRGSLGSGGIPTMGDPIDGDNYRDRGIIDWDMLVGVSAGPEPENDEDWF